MATLTTLDPLPTFTTFGEMLRYLRRQTQLTQRELAIAVGYSESMISRLEHGERPPDVATIHALFVPALHLEGQPQVMARLIELANLARNGDAEDNPKVSAASSRRLYSPKQRLPARLASFVGRNHDIRNAIGLLAETRLVTMTGPGGCGKTSLALEVCRWLMGSSADDSASEGTAIELTFDAICLVELFPLSDPNLLAQTILAALGIESGHDDGAIDALLASIHSRRVLLVLDNCEHLVDAVARFTPVLLQACPNLRVIVTSRERLSIAGETVYEVAPLPCPKPGRLPDLREMMSYPAVQLFVERCHAMTPDFRLTPENAGLIAEICALLDGIPLALELGAAATSTFTVQDIAQRLHAHVLLSSPGFRTADPRHSTINDTVAWSYNLLSPAEQRLLTDLSVFAGGWTVEAIQYICTDQPESIKILRQLVQKSLVNVDRSESPTGRTRYSLLRAIREYAAERLAGSGGEEHARRRHFEYCCQLGITLGDQVLGPQHRAAMAGLDADHANIRAALAFGRAKTDLMEAYARLAAALPYYWRQRGYFAESLAWLRKPLAGQHGLSLGTNALAHAAVLYEMSDEQPYWYHRSMKGNDEILHLLAEAEALIHPCVEQDEVHPAALLMLAVASLQDDWSNMAAGESYVRRAWSILEGLGDARGAALAGNLLTRILLVQGSLDAASALQEQVLATLEHHRMTWCLCGAYWLQSQIANKKYGQADAVHILQRIAKIAEGEEFVVVVHDAYVVLENKHADVAAAMGEQLLARQRPKGPSAMLCLALHQLGRMYLNMGRYQQAQEVLDEALQLYPRLNLTLREPLGPQWSLIDRGQVARLQGDAELAIACFDESIRLFRATPFPNMSTPPLLFRGQAHF